MALPATENFSVANNPLTDSSDWSQAAATSDSGEATGTVYEDGSGNTDDKSAVWIADSFDNGQYSQITMASDSDGVCRIGVILRGGTTSKEAFLVRYKTETGSFEAYYWDSGGTRNSIGSAQTITFNAGDIMKVEVSDSSKDLTLFIDSGAGFVSQYTWTNSNGPASGSPGCYIVYATGTTVQGDDWEGGDLGGAPPAALFNDIYYKTLLSGSGL